MDSAGVRCSQVCDNTGLCGADGARPHPFVAGGGRIKGT